jgi:hypothetical protein
MVKRPPAPDPFRRVEAQCACIPPRLVPVRVAREVVALLASVGVPPDLVVLTFKCRRCGVVQVTARQIRAA